MQSGRLLACRASVPRTWASGSVLRLPASPAALCHPRRRVLRPSSLRWVGSTPTPPATRSSASSQTNPPGPAPPEDDHPHIFLTVPNAMTALRMALGPVAGALIVTGRLPAAVGAMAFAGFLDWADGAWARAFRSQSLLGSFLDPLADKVLLACTAGALAWVGALGPLVTFVVVGRDALLFAGSVVYRARTRPPSEPFWSLTHVPFRLQASLLSKANTAMQIGLVVAAGAQLAWAPLLASWGAPAAAAAVDALSWAVIGTTVASGADYLRRGGLTAMPQRGGGGAGAAGHAQAHAPPPQQGQTPGRKTPAPGGGGSDAATGGGPKG